MYREWRPPLDLASSIECVWLQDHRVDPEVSMVRIPPDGSMDLLFDLAAHRAYWVGATARPILVSPTTVSHTYGIRFVPGAAAPLLGIPAGEITDLNVPSRELGESYEPLLDQLAVLSHAQTRVDRIFDWIGGELRRLPVHGGVSRLVREIRSPRRHQTVEQLASSLGWSRQHLTRLCRAHIGLDAKTFQRTQRLQAVLKTARTASGRPRDWSELALSFGYFDQSHFINDFRELVGLTPGTYFAAVPFFQDGL
jgi:AraC-like DNA-binding protein